MKNIEIERTSIFGNRGRLRRDYDIEEMEELLGNGESESIFPDESLPETHVFSRDGSLRRLFSAADFEIMFGHTHEQRFSVNGSLNGKGGETT